MRICFLGNSHLAALKHAQAQGLVDGAGDDICYFGAIAGAFRQMKLSEGLITTPNTEMALMTSDNRYSALPVKEFDALVFHGNWFSLPEFLIGCAEVDFLPDRASSAFVANLAVQYVSSRSRILRVPRRVARRTSIPVIVSGVPLFARSKDFFGSHPITETRLERIETAFVQAFHRLGITLLRLPTEAITDNVYTREENSVGAVRLREGLEEMHPVRDYRHMNSAYGALVLRDALAAARVALEGRSGTET